MNPNIKFIEAIKDDSVIAMREAMEAGADWRSINAGMESLLEVAQKAGAVHAARFLLDQGMDANVVTKTHETLLHRAARQGDMGFVSLLLEYGADPESRDRKHRRPIDVVTPKGGYVHALLTSKSKTVQPTLF